MEKIGKVIKVTDVIKKGEGYVQEFVIHQEKKLSQERVVQTEEFWPFSVYSKELADPKFLPPAERLKERMVRVTYYERGVRYSKPSQEDRYFINYSLQRWELI